MIPGTETIVAGLVDNELCMDLVNLASNTAGANAPLVPTPQALTVNDNSGGGYVTWRYGCPPITSPATRPAAPSPCARAPERNETNVAGVTVDMAAIQQAVLTNVLNGDDPQPGRLASRRTSGRTKRPASLTPLQGIFNNGRQRLHPANSRPPPPASKARSTPPSRANASPGPQWQSSTCSNGEVQQSTLGWTAAGAYYLEIAKANATTLSLMNATPVTTSPTYDGLGPALSYDLAPLETAAAAVHDDAADGRATPPTAPSRRPALPTTLA